MSNKFSNNYQKWNRNDTKTQEYPNLHPKLNSEVFANPINTLIVKISLKKYVLWNFNSHLNWTALDTVKNFLKIMLFMLIEQEHDPRTQCNLIHNFQDQNLLQKTFKNDKEPLRHLSIDSISPTKTCPERRETKKKLSL